MEAFLLPAVFIFAFIYSVVLHEIAHGFVANIFGDDTAKVSGRLSLNPLIHIDPMGSIVVPVILYISSAGFMFGWAKPVPVNPFRLKGDPASYRWVSAAGVLTNLCLAVVAAIIFKIATQGFDLGRNNLGVVFFAFILQINLILAIFNTIPLPGFDGWNFLNTFSPISRFINKTPLGNPIFMAQYGLMLAILLLLLFMPAISVLFGFVFTNFTNLFGI